MKDEAIKALLERTKSIAFVGVSPNPVRPSFFVYRYMQLRGYRCFAVNPRYAGEPLLGGTVYASLADLPGDAEIDMVDVFRRSEFVPEIYAAAARDLPDLKTVWMQISVRHEETAERARAAGICVVQDRCPKMEYQRLFGELRKAGINTRIISSKLPPLGDVSSVR